MHIPHLPHPLQPSPTTPLTLAAFTYHTPHPCSLHLPHPSSLAAFTYHTPHPLWPSPTPHPSPLAAFTYPSPLAAFAYPSPLTLLHDSYMVALLSSTFFSSTARNNRPSGQEHTCIGLCIYKVSFLMLSFWIPWKKVRGSLLLTALIASVVLAGLISAVEEPTFPL